MKPLRLMLLCTLIPATSGFADVAALELQGKTPSSIGGSALHLLSYDSSGQSSVGSTFGAQIPGSPPTLVHIVLDHAAGFQDTSSASFYFSTRAIPAPMGTGMYADAVSWPAAGPGQAGLNVFFEHQSGCSLYTGDFTVTEFRYEGTSLLSFGVIFEQDCDLTPDGVRGRLRYDKTPTPDLTVEQPQDTILPAGGTRDFGPLVAGSSSTLEFTVRSTGTLALSGLEASLLPGENSPDFSISPVSAEPLTFGQLTTFTVTFTPVASEMREADLRLTSNDPDEGEFLIHLTGGPRTFHEAWRLQHFGTAKNSGPAADESDPDQDGIVNLMEFATASPPLAGTAPPVQLTAAGDTLEFTYSRPTAALAALTYIFEFSDTPASGPWHSAAPAAENIISDNGTLQTVKVTLSAGIAGKRFGRLRVQLR